MRSARLQENPLILLRRTLGDRRAVASKVRKLAVALGAFVDGKQLDARLARLVELGYIERVPNRAQLLAGAADMLRFWIVPAAEDYYASKGINFTFHQILRFLDDPASLVDPTGFLSSRDVIIGHLLQVVHANPRYDFQLLESFDGGLDELERQTRAMLDGSHARAESIRAIVEEPEYHARLLDYLLEYRKDPSAEPPLRENITGRFAPLERTFGGLHTAMRYFAKLPSTPWAALHHVITVREFPAHLGE